MQEFNCENIFFIRYADKGKHLRIRLKFVDESKAIESLKTLQYLLVEWREQGLYSHVVFDTYEPEVNRYGGINILGSLHNVFNDDSIWVMDMLDSFDINNKQEKELVYFIGMVSTMVNLTNSLDELFEMLNEKGLKDSNKDEFKKERNKYLEWFENIKSDTIEEIDERFVGMLDNYKNRNKTFQIFNENLTLNKDTLTNSKNEIVFSLVHMFCNRTTGVIEYERFMLSIIRHTLYSYIQKQKYVIS